MKTLSLYTSLLLWPRGGSGKKEEEKKRTKSLKHASHVHIFYLLIFLIFIFFFIVQYDCHRQEPRHLPHSSVVVFISFGPVNHSYSKIIAYFLFPDDHILLSKMLTLWSVRTINPEKILKTREGKERGSYTLFLSMCHDPLCTVMYPLFYMFTSHDFFCLPFMADEDCPMEEFFDPVRPNL